MNNGFFPPGPPRRPWEREQRPVVALPSCKPVVQLLERAQLNGLRWPKIWLQLPNGEPLRITIAGDKSRTPGFLMVTDGGPYGSGRYYGKISPTGALELGRDATDDIRPSLVALLKALATDPADTAAKYGHLSGQCSFCGLPLKDERSIEVGYGQRCAERFAQPWGGKTRAARRANLLGDL